MTDARQVTDRWHRAIRTGDLDGLMALVADNVVISGPRGSGLGTSADVRDWVQRSGIRLEPRRVYHRGDAVVVEQSARWPLPDHGATGSPAMAALTDEQTVFTAFQVADGRITRLLRFDTLLPALEVSGLTEDDLSD